MIALPFIVFLYLVVGMAVLVLTILSLDESDRFGGLPRDVIIARSILLACIWPLTVTVLLVYGVYKLIFEGVPWVVRNAFFYEGGDS